jgi:hypothetical protein
MVADVAVKAPDKSTLNGFEASVGPVPPDQKAASVASVGLFIPAV